MNVIFWNKYVDDFPAYLYGSDIQLDNFLGHLYMLNPKIKFTLEKQVTIQ